jgi:glycerate kinase
MGKGPGLVIEIARRHKKQIYIIAGHVDSEILAKENIPYLALTDFAPSRDDAISNPNKWLRAAGAELANRKSNFRSPVIQDCC